MDYTFISSRKNATLLKAHSLSTDKSQRDELCLFCAEGVKLLEEAISSGLEIESVFFTQNAFDKYKDILSTCNENACMYLVTDECFDKLSTEKAPQGIFSCIKKPDRPDFCSDEGNFIVLDEIQNPLNIGAIIRCAYSFGQTKIVLSSTCADPYGPKAVRAAMGSLFKVKLFTNVDINDFVKQQTQLGNKVYCTALHTNSVTLGTFEFAKTDSVIFCNEGHGACDELLNLCTDSVFIPMHKGAESLNAATAAAVVLWEKNKHLLKNIQ